VIKRYSYQLLTAVADLQTEIYKHTKKPIMPKLLTAVEHSLGKESAKATLSSFMDEALQTYGDSVDDVQSQWNDYELEFSFKAMGMTVSGQLIVADDVVTINGKIPFALSMFPGKIERTMEDALRKALQ